MSVIVNMTLPSNLLKKKAKAISYYKIRKHIAGKALKFAFVKPKTNHGDIFTKNPKKPLFGPIVKTNLFSKPGHIKYLWVGIEFNILNKLG